MASRWILWCVLVTSGTTAQSDFRFLSDSTKHCYDQLMADSGCCLDNQWASGNADLPVGPHTTQRSIQCCQCSHCTALSTIRTPGFHNALIQCSQWLNSSLCCVRMLIAGLSLSDTAMTQHLSGITRQLISRPGTRWNCKLATGCTDAVRKPGVRSLAWRAVSGLSSFSSTTLMRTMMTAEDNIERALTHTLRSLSHRFSIIADGTLRTLSQLRCAGCVRSQRGRPVGWAS